MNPLKDMTRTNSIDEEVLDYEVSDSEEDLSVKTVESVDLSKSSENKAAKAQRQKSKSRERSANKGGPRHGIFDLPVGLLGITVSHFYLPNQYRVSDLLEDLSWVDIQSQSQPNPGHQQMGHTAIT